MSEGQGIPGLTGVPRRLVSVILGSGVAVALAAAPFLGARRVPMFEPLISVFPEEQRALPLAASTFLLGLVALAVQFYAGEAMARQTIRRRFGLLLPIVAAGPLVLAGLYWRYVVWRPVPPADASDVRQQAFVVGWSRLPGCECPPAESDAQCIDGLSYDPAGLGSCWSDGSRVGVRLALLLSYLVAVEGFAALAGLLVLRPPKPAAKKQPPRRRKRRKAAARSPADKRGSQSAD